MKTITKKMLVIMGALLFSVSAIHADNGKGIDYYRAGLYEAAKIFFMAQTNQSPKEQAENYYYLGETFYEMENPDEASQYYDKSVAVDATYPFGYIGQGRIELKKGNNKAAEDLFKKANNLAKKDPSIQTAIAQVYLDFELYDKVQDSMDKAKKVNKNYPGIYVVEGNMLMQQGKVGEASASYGDAIRFDPNEKLSYLELARVYKKINPVLALDYLTKLIAIDPEYIPAYALIGDINYAQGNYKSALDAYRKFISIPGVPMAQHESYAQILYFTGQYEESLKEIDYIILQNEGNHITRRLQAYNNYGLKNYDKAQELMEQFISSTSDSQKIYLDYMTLGRIYLEQKQPEKAMDAFLNAEKMENAKLPEVYKELTNAYEGQKDYWKAAEYYEKYFAIVPPDTRGLSSDYYYYGRVFYQIALGDMSKVLADPASGVTQEEKDKASEEMQIAIEKGNAAFSKFIELYPTSHIGYYWRGNMNSLKDAVEVRINQRIDGLAKSDFETALGIMLEKNENGVRNNEIIQIYDYLSNYYILSDETDKVIEYNNKILEIDPENAKAKSVLDQLK